MLCVTVPVDMIDLDSTNRNVLVRFQENPALYDEWVNQYGSTMKYKGLFYVR
jgi:hypothetical protein